MSQHKEAAMLNEHLSSAHEHMTRLSKSSRRTNSMCINTELEEDDGHIPASAGPSSRTDLLHEMQQHMKERLYVSEPLKPSPRVNSASELSDLDNPAAGGPPELHKACSMGDLDRVSHLIARGADVRSLDQGGFTPMHWAAYAGCTTLLAPLLKAGSHINATAGQEMLTPLQLAAEEGHVMTVERLVASGALTDARNSDGATALHLAAQNGCRRVVEALMARDADPAIRDLDECNALHIASQYAHHLTMKALLTREHGFNPTPMINSQNRWGLTPLHWATMRGKLSSVELLLSEGADTLLTDRNGNVPADIAAGHRRKKIFAKLVETTVSRRDSNTQAKLRDWLDNHEAKEKNESLPEHMRYFSRTVIRWCKRLGMEPVEIFN